MERSSFFNAIIDKEGIADRSYLAEDFARYFSTFIGNGVFPNPAVQLEVIAIDNNMQIRIKKGFAWINGYMYQNTDDYILTLDNADGVLDRIDRVVLRLDFLKRTIEAVVKKGDWSSTAKAKDLQRDNDAYEIALADIKVSKGAISISQQDITDLRLNKNVCGIVHGVVDQVDTTAIFNQFENWYSTTKTNYDKDIATWTTEKKEAFEKWYLENTEKFFKKINDWYNTNTTDWENKWDTWFKKTVVWEKDFNSWLESLKIILNENAAGNLLNKINKNIKKIDIIEKKVKNTLDENNKKIDEKVQEVTTQYEDLAKTIGNIKDLKTTNKDNLINAINEVFICGVDIKNNLINKLNAEGNNFSKDDNWDKIIDNMNVGKYKEGDFLFTPPKRVEVIEGLKTLSNYEPFEQLYVDKSQNNLYGCFKPINTNEFYIRKMGLKGDTIWERKVESIPYLIDDYFVECNECGEQIKIYDLNYDLKQIIICKNKVLDTRSRFYLLVIKKCLYYLDRTLILHKIDINTGKYISSININDDKGEFRYNYILLKDNNDNINIVLNMSYGEEIKDLKTVFLKLDSNFTILLNKKFKHYGWKYVNIDNNKKTICFIDGILNITKFNGELISSIKNDILMNNKTFNYHVDDKNYIYCTYGNSEKDQSGSPEKTIIKINAKGETVLKTPKTNTDADRTGGFAIDKNYNIYYTARDQTGTRLQKYFCGWKIK